MTAIMLGRLYRSAVTIYDSCLARATVVWQWEGDLWPFY